MKKGFVLKAVFILCAIAVVKPARAQQDMQFTHFMFHNLLYNPGYAGMDIHPKASLTHRSQWLGYKGIDGGGGAPSTQILSSSMPLAYLNPEWDNNGAGLNVIMDKVGALRNINMNLNYARQFYLPVGEAEDHMISMGLSLGFWSQSIDADVLRYGDLDDVTVDNLINNSSAQLKPDVSIGVYYQGKEKYHFGISLNHASKPNFDFKGEADSRLSRHMYLIGGYNHPIKEKEIILSPSAIILTDFHRVSYNFGSLVMFHKEKIDFWGGFGLRQSFGSKEVNDGGTRLANDAFSLIAGIGFMTEGEETKYKAFRLSYALDLITSGKSAKRATSHEFTLSYILPIKLPSGNNSPRYQHSSEYF